MKNLTFGLILFYFVISFNVRATIIECENIDVLKCMCEASMIMKCGKVQGHIKNNSTLTHLKVIVKSSDGNEREFTFNNPPGDIRNYYSIRDNTWIKKNIKNLNASDEISVAKNGYGIDDSTKLYHDKNATRIIDIISK